MTEEYLKYVGWMISDPAVDARLEAVEALKAIVEVRGQFIVYLSQVIGSWNDISIAEIYRPLHGSYD